MDYMLNSLWNIPVLRHTVPRCSWRWCLCCFSQRRRIGKHVDKNAYHNMQGLCPSDWDRNRLCCDGYLTFVKELQREHSIDSLLE